MALDGLAVEGDAHAGGPAVRLAHDRAERFDALAGGELARDLEIGRGVGRRRQEGLGRQERVARENRREFLLRGGGQGQQG